MISTADSGFVRPAEAGLERQSDDRAERPQSGARPNSTAWLCDEGDHRALPPALGADARVVIVEPHAEAQDLGRIARVPSLKQAVEKLAGVERGVIYLRSGSHHLQRPLLLTGQMRGLAILACPGESPLLAGTIGSPTIILRDTSDITLSGLTFTGLSPVQIKLQRAENCVIVGNTFIRGYKAIVLDHSSSNSIVKNLVTEVADTGFELYDQSDSNLIEENIIDGAGAPETYGGGIFMHGVNNNVIKNNLISNTQGLGIGILNWDEGTTNVGNIVIHNLLRDTALSATDSGAIYILGRSGVDTQTIIAGNVIDRVGDGSQHTVGIYLDDSTGGTRVIGNLVRRVGSDAVQIHGGSDNLIENNLLDLGSEHPSAVLFQAAPADTHPLNAQAGNAVTHNVIVSAVPDPKLFSWLDGGHPFISNNLYINPRNVVPPIGTLTTDVAPVRGDPELAKDVGWDSYTAIQAAAAAAIGFKPIDIHAAGPRSWARMPRARTGSE